MQARAGAVGCVIAVDRCRAVPTAPPAGTCAPDSQPGDAWVCRALAAARVAVRAHNVGDDRQCNADDEISVERHALVLRAHSNRRHAV